MRRFIQQTLNPTWYHGHTKRGPFFEGWYFKLIDPSENTRYAFIPGVFINSDSSKTHAFIQVLDGLAGTATYHPYPINQFHASYDSFQVQIGTNQFTQDYIQLDIDDKWGNFRGKIHFENLNPWPVTLSSPGIMGWYGWLPFMECYHGVVSLDHTIHGSLQLNRQEVDFTGGRGYIEKDWGSNFPSGYIWQQTNHFDTLGTSLTASIATIPLKVFKFPGFIIGLWHDKNLYRFATYTGAQLEKLTVSDAKVEWSVFDKSYHLKMCSQRSEGGLLMGPNKTDMHMRVDETMKSSIEVTLSSAGFCR